MKNFCQKWLVEKLKIVWREKPSRAQLFRYFGYKSQNNKLNNFNLVCFPPHTKNNINAKKFVS